MPAWTTPCGSTGPGGRTTWSLFDLQALVNAGGRATIRATMHGADGTLHLSMAQELLIRELETRSQFDDAPWRSSANANESGVGWTAKEGATMGLLDGQRAVVTGGGSGIGRATCRRMAEEGARVAVLDFNAEAAQAVADEIGGISYQVDVGDADGAAPGHRCRGG